MTPSGEAFTTYFHGSGICKNGLGVGLLLGAIVRETIGKDLANNEDPVRQRYGQRGISHPANSQRPQVAQDIRLGDDGQGLRARALFMISQCSHLQALERRFLPKDLFLLAVVLILFVLVYYK